MLAADLVGGITRLQRTSTRVGESSGVTAARPNSGPIVKPGFGRVARKTWACAAPGTVGSRSAARPQALGRDRPQLAREVLLGRELLLDHAVLEERPFQHGEPR